MVGFFLKMCEKVMAIPLKIAGRYMRSHKLMGFRETGFTLLVNASIIFLGCKNRISIFCLFIKI